MLNKLSIAATLIARSALLVLLLADGAMAGMLHTHRSPAAVERIDNSKLLRLSAAKAAAPGRERLRVPNGADVAPLSAASELAS